MIKNKFSLIIVVSILAGCTNSSNAVNPEPIPTISSSVTVSSSSPTPSSSISTVSPTPSITPTTNQTPTPSVYENPNAIKKVELYSGRYNKLFPIDESNIYKLVVNYRYYDLKPYAKITYNNGRSEDKQIILESSNKEIAHIENNVLYVHSKDNKSGFNLIIQDKETTIELASYKLDLTESTDSLSVTEFVELSGKVYDKEGNIIKDAKVTFEYLDLALTLSNKYPLITQPTLGEFKIAYVMTGAKVGITVEKEGYKTTKRTIISKFNITGLENANINFGGEKEEDKPYALEKL